ncbi:MAG: hypothetical protein Kow0059_21640 [Candidatus Sumerlaeia bacterium]
MTMPATSAHPVRDYFHGIWSAVVTCLKGLAITWDHFWRRPVTVQYPEQPVKPESRFRGLHVYDVDQCDACFLCAKACPVECLTLETEGRGKNAVVKRYSIDYSKCLFCNLCTEPCPTYAIWMGAEWDLSAFSRQGCVVNFNVEPSTPGNRKDPEVEARKAYRRASPPPPVQNFRSRRDELVAAGDEAFNRFTRIEALRAAKEAQKAAKKAAAAKPAAAPPAQPAPTAPSGAQEGASTSGTAPSEPAEPSGPPAS